MEESTYSAGELKLEILSENEKSVASIDKLIRKLNSLSNCIKLIEKTDLDTTFNKLAESLDNFSQQMEALNISGIEKLSSLGKAGSGIKSLAKGIDMLNSSQSVFAGQQLELLFEKISKATNSIDTTNLDRLATSAKALASISKIGNLSNMDFSKVSAGFAQLSNSITPFIQQIQSAESSLNSLYGSLSILNGKSNGINASTGKSQAISYSKGLKGAKAISGLFNIVKWTAVIHTAKRLGSVVYKISKDGADYTETLNLWRVSMGEDLIPQATEFVNKMNEAYGVSEKTLMNAQAIFKNMVGSLGGVSKETAYYLSEGITQMALDYASLYNQKFEDAFTKFQAALAGQVRPIRSISGYDITENTLYEVYKSLGGEKTMRQLSQTEKRLLSIYAIFRQMEASNAIGDLDRTMESFANQSRVFADSWSDVKNYAGVLLTYVIQESGIFTKINAGLIFLSELLKGIATKIGAFNEFEDPFASTTDSADLATEAVDNLNGKLTEFDKFRALNESNDTNALGLDEKLLEALSSYNSILETSKMDARELANTWLEIIGLIDQNEDGIIDMQEAIDAFNTKLDEIDFGKIGKGFSDQTLSIINWLDTLVDELDWSAVGKSFGEWFNSIDWAQLGIDTLDFLLSFAGGVASAIAVGITTIDWEKVFQDIWEIFKTFIMEVFPNFVNNLFKTAGIDLTKDYGSWGKPPSIIPTGYASGGLPDKGSMFIAGEAGAEYVYNMPSGQSGVANIQQISQATYHGTMSALRDWWGGTGAKGDIPQLKEASATGLYQTVTGVAKTYGERWSQY